MLLVEDLDVVLDAVEAVAWDVVLEDLVAVVIVALELWLLVLDVLLDD